MKWFIADLHLDHQFVLGLRQKEYNFDFYSSLSSWQEYIVDKIMSLTRKGDDVYHLGDFAFHKPNMAKFKQQMPGRNHWLIRGNHDPPFFACEAIFGKGKVRDMMDVKCAGQSTVLCHYPMAMWNKSHYGSYLLYGHVHNMRTKTLDRVFPGRRSLDVGPESLYNALGEVRPINENEVHDILSAQPGHDPVEYYREERWKLE